MVLNRYNYIENLNKYYYIDLFEDKTLSKEELKYKLYWHKMALDNIIKH